MADGATDDLLTCDGCVSRGETDVFVSHDPKDFLVCDPCGLFLCPKHVDDCKHKASTDTGDQVCVSLRSALSSRF